MPSQHPNIIIRLTTHFLPKQKKTFFFLPKMQTRSQAPVQIAASQPFLPWELIDEILVRVGDPELAIDLERFSIVRNINIEYDFNWAMVNVRLDYLKHLNGRGLCAGEYKRNALQNCARYDKLNILKYCHEHINPITSYDFILDQAASNGYLDLVKYLHSIGSACTKML
jgi:hypothetical protein